MGDIENLVERLAQDAVTVKPAPHPFIICIKWMGIAAAYLALSLMLSGWRPDLMLKLHEPWFVAEIAALVGIFATTSISAALLGFPDLHQMRRGVFAPAVMIALFMLIIFFSWHTDNPPAPLPVHSFECTLYITLPGNHG